MFPLQSMQRELIIIAAYTQQQMIRGKYRQLQVLKDRDYKLIQRCAKQDGSHLFLKSYATTESRLIQNEIQTYQKLKQPHLHGFPQIKEAFEENTRAYLVIEELGANIDSLRLQCGGRLTLKTVLLVGLQMLERIEYLHSNGVLHGDIKPSNFLVGRGKLRHKIYLTDFELSSPYLRNGKHVPEEPREKFNGSLRFSSRAANAKTAICRRDELESYVYSLVFLLKGELPWMEIKAKNMQAANEEVLELKGKRRAELLEGLPDHFRQILAYLDELKFASTPDYDRIRNVLQALIKKNGYEADYKYDWEYL